MACCLIGLAWVGVGTAPAQIFQQITPNQPAKTPPGKIVPKLSAAEQARRGVKADVVVASKLNGVRFVSAVKEVQLQGFSSPQKIVPGDVPFASRSDFQAVIQPYLGQPVTMSSLDNLTSALVTYYRNHDRPIVNVFVPQQNVTNGYLQIVVAEGRVGQVNATGAKWFSNADLRRDLRLHAGDPISGEMLRSDLDWMNRNPFHQSDLVFGPGDTPGLTDITVKTKDRFPLRLFAGVDDAGNQYTGNNRYYTGFNYGNLFGLDDQLSYQFSMAGDTNEFTAQSGSWVMPLPWRHILTIYGNYGQATANVPGPIGMPFHSSGSSWQTSLRYEVPLRAPQHMTQSLIGGFDFKSSNNNLAFGGVPVFSNTYANIAQFVVGYQASYTDPYGTTMGSFLTFLSPGGITSGNSVNDFQALRYGAEPNYVYGQLNLQRVTRLPYNFTWIERGEVQWSDANLLSSEQIGLGGYDTVRGYDEREVNGDSGFFLSSQIETPPVSLGNMVGIAKADDQLKFLAFVDYGGTSLHNPGPSDTNPSSNLLGVGPGIRYDITPYMTFRFDYGFQLINTGFNPGQTSRAHFGLVCSLPGGDDDSEHLLSPKKDSKDITNLKEFDVSPSFVNPQDFADNGTGFNLNAYGGITGLQNSTATMSAPDAPGFVNPNHLTATQENKLGGVGGLRVGYTWREFSSSVPWLMPALDLDTFWSGYKYETLATTSAYNGSTLSANLNTYNLLLEPKVKFNLGNFRPYVGFGVGGTYLHADNSYVNLQSTIPKVGSTTGHFTSTLDAGSFSVAGTAGLEYFLNPHWALTLDYKHEYMDVQGSVKTAIPGITPPVHVLYNVNGIGSNMFSGGLSYYFF
jgi:hemolysin activation/secretion protein